MAGPMKFPPVYFAMCKPGQRKRDHGARKREAEWRAYQALWQKPIDQIECNAERFYNLRRYVLTLNREQTARLLRVGVQSVLNWEKGEHPVPFYAYLALLLISESQHYRLANEAWREWEFIEHFNADAVLPKKHWKHITYIVNRKTGACFEPEDLNRLHFTMQELARLDSQRHELEHRADSLTAENTKLREMFLADGVTAELHSMQDRLQKLLGRINTAEVVELKKVASG